YFAGLGAAVGELEDLQGTRPLAAVGDSVNTEHTSRAGASMATSPAGAYLQHQRDEIQDINRYGTRRGNHDGMIRSTLAKERFKKYLRIHPTHGCNSDDSPHRWFFARCSVDSAHRHPDRD